MAITRIKNNQIFDNTIDGNAKILDNSIPGGKLVPNLTYASNLTISGNLQVTGTTTQVDTTSTSIEDAVILLASNQTGNAATDIGWVGNRGDDPNIAFIWKEAEDQFVLGFTTSTAVSNIIDVTSLANLRVGTVEADSITGDLAFPSLDANGIVFLNGSGELSTSGNLEFVGSTLTLDGVLEVDDLTLDGTSISSNAALTLGSGDNGNISITPDGTGSTVVSALAFAGFDADRVVFTSTNGAATVSANMTFDGSDLVVTGSATVDNITLDGTSITSDSVISIAATGNVTLTPTGGDVIVDSAAVVATQVLYAGANKEVVSNAGLTFDGTTLESTGGIVAGDVAINGASITSDAGLTIASADGEDVTITGTGAGVVVIEGVSVDGASIATTGTDVDLVLAPNGTGAVDVSSSKIVNVADPDNDQDAATKAYVDTAIGTGGFQIVQNDTSVVIDDAGDSTLGVITTTVDGTSVIVTTEGETTFTQDVTVSGSLTVDNVEIDGNTVSTSAGDLTLAPATGVINVGGTPNQVFFAGAAGELDGDAEFTWNGSTLSVDGTVDATVVEAGDLTLATTVISSTGNITLEPTANVIVDNATATQVFFAGANKELIGAAGLTFDGTILESTGGVTGGNITIAADGVTGSESVTIASGNDGNIVLSPDGNGVVLIENLQLSGATTPYRVVFTNADGDLATDGNLTFDGDDFVVSPLGTATLANVVIADATINTLDDDETLTIAANGNGEFYVDRNVTISGDLSVLGTTTTVNSTVVTIADPIIELGRGPDDSPLTSNDGKDRGVRLWYWDIGANEERSAWMGYDHPTHEFRYFDNATVTDEEVTGDLGHIRVGKITLIDDLDPITGGGTWVQIDENSITSGGALQIISGLDEDITLNANGAGKVVVPTGDQFRVADLDVNRVVYTTTGGELVTTGNLTFNGTALVLDGSAKVDNVTIDGSSITSDTGLSIASADGEDVTITGTGAGVVVIEGVSVDGATIATTGTNANLVLAPNGTGVVDVSTSKIVNVVDPTDDQDVATKAYVDGAIGAGGFQISQDDTSIVVNDDGIDPGAIATTVDNVVVIVTTADDTTFTQDVNVSGTVTVTGDLAVDNVTIDGNTVSTSTGNLVLSSDTGVIQVGGTATQVFFAGAAGELAGSGNLTWDSDTLTVAGTVDATTVEAGDLTLATDTMSSTGNIVLDPTANVIVDNATATQVFFAGANKELIGAAGLTFDGTILESTGGVTGGNVTMSGNSVASTQQLDITSGNNGNINITPDGTGVVNITNLAIANLDANRVVVTDANGAFVDDDNFTYSVATSTLVLDGIATVGNITVSEDTIEGTGELDIIGGTAIELNPGTGNVVISNATANEVFFAGPTRELIGSANLTFDGTVLTSTGGVTAGNVEIAGNNITGTNGVVTVNEAGEDVNFVVYGEEANSTIPVLLSVDAADGAVVVGSDDVTAGATFKIDATDSMLIPVGTTAERPGVPVAGMMRYNDTISDIEFFDGTMWKPTATEFTLIASETFNGDDSTEQFTLAEAATTASVIVSINGVLQQPTVSYSVSGTTLTFNEPPATGDVIEVRRLTTTTVFSLEVVNSAETARLTASESGAFLEVTGDLVPTANETYDLGSPTFRWNELHLSGSTIYLGDKQIKVDAGEIKFFEADGTTIAPITAELSGDIEIDGGEY